MHTVYTIYIYIYDIYPSPKMMMWKAKLLGKKDVSALKRTHFLLEYGMITRRGMLCM